MKSTNKINLNKIVIFIFCFVIAEHQPLLLSVHHPSGDAVLGHVQHPVSALQNRHSGTLFSPSDSGPTKLEDAELGQPVGDLLQLDDKQEPEQEIDVVGVGVGEGGNAVPVSQQGSVPRHSLSRWEGQDSFCRETSSPATNTGKQEHLLLLWGQTWLVPLHSTFCDQSRNLQLI